MIKFETSKYYRVNQIDANPAYVCSRTKDFITVLYNHRLVVSVWPKPKKTYIFQGFFNNSEHINIPTEYKNCNLFCVAVNAI